MLEATRPRFQPQDDQVAAARSANSLDIIQFDCKAVFRNDLLRRLLQPPTIEIGRRRQKSPRIGNGREKQGCKEYRGAEANCEVGHSIRQVNEYALGRDLRNRGPGSAQRTQESRRHLRTSPGFRFAQSELPIPPRSAYHRISVAPQVKPPPMASSITRSPRLMRRSCTASASASGIEAAEVLPWRSSVSTTCSGLSPSFLATPSMMRLLAWCGTNQSMSSAAKPDCASAPSTASEMAPTAARNTSRPSMRR